MARKQADDNAETPRARFERLKAEVLTLTPKQRRDIVALLGGGEGPADDTPTARAAGVSDRNVAGVYEAIVAALEAAVAAPSAMPPLSVAMKRNAAELRAATSACDLMLSHHASEHLRAAARNALYHACSRIVLEHMRRASIPVTLRTLTQQMANIASIMDDAFPGYANAGLLRIVLDRMVGGVRIEGTRPSEESMAVLIDRAVRRR